MGNTIIEKQQVLDLIDAEINQLPRDHESELAIRHLTNLRQSVEVVVFDGFTCEMLECVLDSISADETIDNETMQERMSWCEALYNALRKLTSSALDGKVVRVGDGLSVEMESRVVAESLKSRGFKPGEDLGVVFLKKGKQ